MTDKQRHNAKMKRYRDQAHKHRLELMIRPELKERFSALPGLEEATNAQRLAALCTLWERQYPAVPIPPELLEENQAQEPAAADKLPQAEQLPHKSPTLPAAFEPAPPLDPGLLDSALQQLDELDAQLLADQAADLAEQEPAAAPSEGRPFWFDESLPNIPPRPEKGYYQGLATALGRLYEREWPRRKHGNTEEAKRWKTLLRKEPELLRAFRSLTFNKTQLADLIRHCCLMIRPNDLLAWAELEPPDREAILWHLIHGGGIYPEALGEVRERFQQALERQPERHFFTWERKA